MERVQSKKRWFIHSIISGVLVLLCGCGPTIPQWAPEKERKVFDMSRRQLAPDPVYSRRRWVEAPEVLPDKELPKVESAKIMPVIHLELKNASLDTAAKSLASTARYHSYCESTIAKKKVSVNTLGTLDELANEIATKADIKVVVDHDTRELRFMAKNVTPELLPGQSKGGASEAPKVSSNKVTGNEHQSNN